MKIPYDPNDLYNWIDETDSFWEDEDGNRTPVENGSFNLRILTPEEELQHQMDTCESKSPSPEVRELIAYVRGGGIVGRC